MARVSDHALSYYSPSHPSLLVDASGMHVDEILHQQFNTSPVLKTDSIYSVRDKVCGSILEELNLPDPRCVGCYRYGPSIRREENPPIIIVGIRDKTTRSFHDDNKKVQGILECFGVRDTSVLFRKESS